ncbi:hypothetical protein D9M68_991520 [compost metagenome]
MSSLELAAVKAALIQHAAAQGDILAVVEVETGTYIIVIIHQLVKQVLEGNLVTSFGPGKIGYSTPVDSVFILTVMIIEEIREILAGIIQQFGCTVSNADHRAK